MRWRSLLWFGGASAILATAIACSSSAGGGTGYVAANAFGGGAGAGDASAGGSSGGGQAGGGGGAGGVVGGDSFLDGPECVEPTPGNPLLGCEDLSLCAPQVCDPEGATWGELNSQLKEFYENNTVCTPPPADILCKMKTVLYGPDWPAQVDAVIAQASADAGGFLPSQIAALRCLAYKEPSAAFDVIADAPGSKAPTVLLPALEINFVGSSAEEAVMSQLNVLLGHIFHITPDYIFVTYDSSQEPYFQNELWFIATKYKGIPVEDKIYMRISLTPVKAYMPDFGTLHCSRLFIDGIYADLPRTIQDIDTDPASMIDPNDAVQAALQACGAACSYPGMGWYKIAPPELRISKTNLFWRTHVRCPSLCPQVTDWGCTYDVDAHSGQVLSGGVDSGVDDC